jgi:arylsulfatase A-like enzyme
MIIAVATVAGLLQASTQGLLPAIEGTRPNVLLIYSDDQGALDAGCYGATDLKTPNIDKLAATGIRLTGMYAPSAICSASRAGLLTGKIPYRAGVPANVSSQPGVAGMPGSEYTLAELFRDNGYHTVHTGKWHLGFSEDTMPNAQGFDESYGHMGGCIDNFSHFFYWNGPNRHDLWRNGVEIHEDGQFFGSRMVEEVKDHITPRGTADDEPPFFVYWAINFPHYPLQGTQKWRDYYRNLPEPRNMYNAFVSTMDEMIGEVIDHLEQTGQRDNTIIVFQSDHGHSVEIRAFGGGGFAGPFRGCKGNFFEGGLRVPSIISWPAGLPGGQVHHTPAIGMDWFPTLAELCRLEIPDRVIPELDGQSIAGLLRDGDARSGSPRTFYWQLGAGQNAQWAVRNGRWKLLGNSRDPMAETQPDPLFLADLGKDISETTNHAIDHPEIVAQLQEERGRYLKRLEE